MAKDSGPPRRVQLDAAALRVLAHPLRSRLLSRLRRHGPANATALAEALATNTGATSYHLRKLAAVGLVEETEDGSGRERWWRSAHDVTSWSAGDFEGNDDAQAALGWLEGEYLRSSTAVAEDWLARREAWAEPWREAATFSDALLRLTPERLGELTAELHGLMERYQQVPEEDGAVPVVLYVRAFPDPDQVPPGSDR